MNSDGDKLYMKFVSFDEIYNFAVQTFFHVKSSWAKKVDILSRFFFGIHIWIVYQIFLTLR
jgi:hypothetical protein